MNFKQALDRWLKRHQTGSNRLLHALGIPATIVGVVLLFAHLWLAAALFFVAGYVLQVIGHYLEGSRVGELILLQKVFLPTGRFPRRLLIITLLVGGLVVAGLTAQVFIVRGIYFNLHETIGAGMYRSGQMPADELAQTIERLGIKTVVNLVAQDNNPWYAFEREVVLSKNARFIHLPTSASAYPDPKRLNQLLKVVEKIEPPFLVHCDGGADRTGLFFTLLALREGQDWDQAMGQLSLLRFGYYSRMASAAITYPLYDFANYADRNHWPKNLEQFRLWLKSDDARQSYQNWLNGQRPRARD